MTRFILLNGFTSARFMYLMLKGIAIRLIHIDMCFLSDFHFESNLILMCCFVLQQRMPNNRVPLKVYLKINFDKHELSPESNKVHKDLPSVACQFNRVHGKDFIKRWRQGGPIT